MPQFVLSILMFVVCAVIVWVSRALRIRTDDTLSEAMENAIAQQRQSVKVDMIGWGALLLLSGVAHFLVPRLEKDWGYILIGIAVAAIVFRHRVMYYIIGLALYLAAFNNAFAVGGPTGIAVGLVQFSWGSWLFNRARMLFAV
jgi:hypothetical protein